MTGTEGAGAAGPLISVVVPCWNAAWSVGDTLASIRAQRLADLEILLIDDGSTEDLSSALAPHLADPRLRVIRQENRGLAGARNRGLAEARAPFVAFLDADDLWHPDFLARSHAALLADPAAPFAFAGSFQCDEANRYLRPSPWEGTGTRLRHDLTGLASVNLVGNGSAALFRRDGLRAVGGFDETMRARGAHGAEDWKLCLLMAGRGTPAMIAEPLVGYRLVGSGMSQGDPRRQMRAAEMVIADLAPQMPQVPASAWNRGRLMTAGWLLPAYLRQGLLREAVVLMAGAYLRAPDWFRAAALRRAHLMKIRNSLHALAGHPPAGAGEPLALRRDPDGSRPFAFLAAPPGTLPSGRPGRADPSPASLEFR